MNSSGDWMAACTGDIRSKPRLQTINNVSPAGGRIQRYSNFIQHHSNFIQQHSNIIQEHSNIIQKHFSIIQQHATAFQLHSTVFQLHPAAFQPHSTAIQPHSTANTQADSETLAAKPSTRKSRKRTRSRPASGAPLPVSISRVSPSDNNNNNNKSNSNNNNNNISLYRAFFSVISRLVFLLLVIWSCTKADALLIHEILMNLFRATLLSCVTTVLCCSSLRFFRSHFPLAVPRSVLSPTSQIPILSRFWLPV
jgi:hypothetical protein